MKPLTIYHFIRSYFEYCLLINKYSFCLRFVLVHVSGDEPALNALYGFYFNIGTVVVDVLLLSYDYVHDNLSTRLL